MLHVTGKMYSGSRTSREAVAAQFFGGPVAVIIVLYIPPHALLTIRSGNHAAARQFLDPQANGLPGCMLGPLGSTINHRKSRSNDPPKNTARAF